MNFEKELPFGEGFGQWKSVAIYDIAMISSSNSVINVGRLITELIETAGKRV